MEFEMEVKVMGYCLQEYGNYILHGGSVEKAIDRCYGAVMFAINNCFETYNKNLGDWWSDTMLPRFRALEKR